MYARRTASRLGLVAALLLVLVAPARADDLAEAKAAAQKRDWNAAWEKASKALEADPTSREAAALVTRVYAEGGVLDAFPVAEDAWNRLLAADPADRVARVGLGGLYLAKARDLASDPTARSSVSAWFADAAAQFSKALEASGGTDESAAAGLVEGHYLQGAFDRAIETADALLAKKPSSPKVAFWKGQALYLKARDAYAKDASSEAAKDLFRKAKGAFESSVRGDPASFDAWMQLAYASQYVAAYDDARAAYEHAMDLAPESDLPIKGIEALYLTQPQKYLETLEHIVRTKPKYLPARWYLGWSHLSAKRYDEAVKVLQAYAKEAKDPSTVLGYLAAAYEGKGDTAKAREAYEDALKANPANDVAAAGIEKALLAEYAKKGGGGLDAAKDLVKSYKPLLAAAPKNVYIRNNLGFVLREAVGQHGRRKGRLTEVDDAALPMLKESVRLYDEATEIIGELRPEITALPYETRYGYAQIISDTGLMYWFYPQVRDVEKARTYYERALELSGGAYRDACVNLIELLMEKQDYEEAYRVAIEGADLLSGQDGRPDEGGRIYVSKIAKDLVSSGKVKGDE
jgi:tetratricopeptide (TPR) repeat protein